MRKIENHFLQHFHYHIVVVHHIPYEYIIKITDNNDDLDVGQVNMVVVENDNVSQPYGRRLRSSSSIETDVIGITWLGVHSKGKGIGTLLLIYGLCYVSSQRPHIQYARLDDDSSRSNHIRNIYSGLMFAYDDHTKLMNKGRVSLSGPEKTAYIGDPNYIQLLNKKVHNYIGGKTHKKTRKKNIH